MTSLPAPDSLLADTAWLRRLTQRLTGDTERAADLHQDVALAALAQPEAAALGRSWLAAVARNLAVSLRRRRAVEQRGVVDLPAHEPSPSPADLVATAELQQRAVAAVLALPAVYRDTVLLRFMQGRSVAATALAMGVPEETVRTRQKRALAMLRTQLAPARERRSIAAVFGSMVAWGIAMKIKHVVVAAVLLLGAMWVTAPFWIGGSASPPAPPAGTSAVAHADLRRSADANAAAEPVAPTQRVEIASSPAGTAETTASCTVHVTWQDDGAPATFVPVQCRRRTESGAFAYTDTAGDVTFADLMPGEFEVGTHDWQFRRVSLAAGEHAVLQSVLPRGRSVAGVVQDANGAPVAGAAILVSATGTAPQWSFPAGRSDAQGRFQLGGLRELAMVGACHERHGTSDFRWLLLDQGVATPEQIVLQLPRAAVSLRGRVVDAAGTAIAGAWVEVGSYTGRARQDERGRMWQPPPASYCTSAADGSFVADSLPAGQCPVLVYRAGFAPYRATVTLAADAGPMLVTLHEGGVLTGTVRDAAGNAVVGAEVEVEPYDYPRRCFQEIAADGAFRLDDLPRGELTFRVTAPAFSQQEQTFSFAGSEVQQWDVVLHDEHTIRGCLVDHDGQPLANWWVARCGASRRAKTDAQGCFVIAECDADGNELIVRETMGFVPERTRFADVEPAPGQQTFVVPADSAPSAQMRGRCVDSEGAPLADAMLQLTQANWPISFEGDRCGPDGGFAVGPLPKGSYQLWPRHPEFVFAPIEPDLKASETRELGVLRGARPARLVVRVCGEPAATADAVIALVGAVPVFRSQGDGSERTFVRVFPGRYRIVAHRGELEQDCGEIELAPGAEIVRDVTVQ